ncbi:MAG: hypothetical protein AAFX05_10040 [Planctomycetota bacterium]
MDHELTAPERQSIDEAILKYYDWFVCGGEDPPDKIMESLPSQAARREFLDRSDDLIVILGFLQAGDTRAHVDSV